MCLVNVLWNKQNNYTRLDEFICFCLVIIKSMESFSELYH